MPDGAGGLFLVSATRTLHRDAAGKVKPIAETGSASGAAAVGRDGTLWLGRGDRVVRVRPGGGADVVAEGLGEVFGLALGPEDELFATDWEGGRVWRVAGGKKTVVAEGLEHPSGVVCDPKGVLYVKESGRQTRRDMRIRRIPKEGVVTLFATVPSLSRHRAR